ncbi:MAG: type I 3-dehydroquinate dehydratase [Candidatus Bathyarchaeota archaeon]|nr:type I 3-dehydroquinate dehydratase [Candidatus Bathyarchaeota archaeon]MDH5531881.1 type I 3-dehydroquinate dehydratase [Candidatus Bathyarchaeota archaeon]MDH5712748.1 type I 3-dehydroquinate dehydratase [Candidatus Bathyarchaeota archaeon]
MICVSVLPETVAEALELIERAENHYADLVEVRLDSLGEPDELSNIAGCSRVPLIATNRSAKCHGEFRGSETERKQILLKAAGNGFEYVDIELSTSELKDTVSDVHEMGVKPIVSFHDFNQTPSLPRMEEILRKEIASGADICKVVTTAKSAEDNLTVLDFVSKACKSAKTICFSMGELGKISRLLSPLFGGFLTFASLEKGRETASGQLTIQEMRVAYEALGAI